MKDNRIKPLGKVLSLAALAFMASVVPAGVDQARVVPTGVVHVTVDGLSVHFSGAQPQVVGDHVVVPLREVFEKLGAKVDWKPEIQTVLASKGTTHVEFRIKTNELYVNGKAVPMPNKPIDVQGTTMVPLRLISESLGAFVDWDEAASTVFITSHQPKVNRK